MAHRVLPASSRQIRSSTNGADDTYMVGRYGLGSGAEAYSTSGYLAANMKFELIPEVSTSMSLAGLAGLAGLGLLSRRR